MEPPLTVAALASVLLRLQIHPQQQVLEARVVAEGVEVWFTRNATRIGTLFDSPAVFVSNSHLVWFREILRELGPGPGMVLYASESTRR